MNVYTKIDLVSWFSGTKFKSLEIMRPIMQLFQIRKESKPFQKRGER